MLPLYFSTHAMQASPAKADQPTVQRVFKKHQTDRYTVVIDSEGPSGKAHYDYQLKFFAEHQVVQSTDTKIAATFINLKANYNGMDAPLRKTFGVATYQFPTVGFPLDYSLAGEETALVVPILSWYLPREAVTQGEKFNVAEMVFDKTIHVSGSGSLLKLDANSATFKLDLTFFVGNKPPSQDEKATSYSSTATFNLKSGVLIKSEGELSSTTGTMNFRLQRL